MQKLLVNDLFVIFHIDIIYICIYLCNHIKVKNGWFGGLAGFRPGTCAPQTPWHCCQNWFLSILRFFNPYLLFDLCGFSPHVNRSHKRGLP